VALQTRWTFPVHRRLSSCRPARQWPDALVHAVFPSLWYFSYARCSIRALRHRSDLHTRTSRAFSNAKFS